MNYPINISKDGITIDESIRDSLHKEFSPKSEIDIPMDDVDGRSIHRNKKGFWILNGKRGYVRDLAQLEVDMVESTIRYMVSIDGY